ncbi:MAG: M16 family metallopeptidase [Vulcanimicrobiota bacterium]
MKRKTPGTIILAILVVFLTLMPLKASEITFNSASSQELSPLDKQKNFSSIFRRREYDPRESQYLHRRLENGLEIYAREKPGTGTVAAEFIIKVGAMEEMDTYAGLTNVIQEVILRGGGPENSIKLHQEVEADGCMLTTEVHPDYARISFIATPDIFKQNFAKLARVLAAPDFSGKILEDVKERQKHIVENDESAYTVINGIFLKHFYRYHPYRQPPGGFKNTIDRITPEVAEEFYARNYSSDRITVAVVGDINGIDALDLAEKELKNLPRRKREVTNIPWEPVGQEKKLYMATYSNVAWLFVGFPAPHVGSVDYAKMKVLSAVLGEGMSSRLFDSLREKEGLAYSLNADFINLEGPAHFTVYVVTKGDKLYQARKLFFKEINLLKKQKLDYKELEKAKSKIKSKLLMAEESNAGKAFVTAYYASAGLGPDFQQKLIQKLDSITPEDVLTTARKYLENYTVLQIETVKETPRFNYGGSRF